MTPTRFENVPSDLQAPETIENPQKTQGDDLRLSPIVGGRGDSVPIERTSDQPVGVDLASPSRDNATQSAKVAAQAPQRAPWATDQDHFAERLRALREAAEQAGDYGQADSLSGALRAHLDAVRREGAVDVVRLDLEREKRKR